MAFTQSFVTAPWIAMNTPPIGSLPAISSYEEAIDLIGDGFFQMALFPASNVLDPSDKEEVFSTMVHAMSSKLSLEETIEFGKSIREKASKKLFFTSLTCQFGSCGEAQALETTLREIPDDSFKQELARVLLMKCLDEHQLHTALVAASTIFPAEDKRSGLSRIVDAALHQMNLTIAYNAAELEDLPEERYSFLIHIARTLFAQGREIDGFSAVGKITDSRKRISFLCSLIVEAVKGYNEQALSNGLSMIKCALQKTPALSEDAQAIIVRKVTKKRLESIAFEMTQRISDPSLREQALGLFPKLSSLP